MVELTLEETIEFYSLIFNDFKNNPFFIEAYIKSLFRFNNNQLMLVQ